MNIFELYFEKIIKLIKFSNNINFSVELPPKNQNSDISCNVAMVLSKTNNKSPVEIAELITDIIKKNDENLDEIKIEKPGFINLKFKKSFWNNFLESIINDNKYGSKKLNNPKKYLIEFVSANPTGPLHVGNCRGAILGDVISNLLMFNNH